MEDANKKRMENLKTTIRRILKEKGLYSEEMTYQVELLASDLLVFRKIRDKAMADMEEPIIKEVSREGAERLKENPIFGLMMKFADRVRKDLRSLKMNKELDPTNNDNNDENDALTELMNSVKNLK